jgi:hypothetical protein
VIGQLKKIFSKTIWPNKFKFGRSTYGRFCIKFLQNKMTGSDHLASSFFLHHFNEKLQDLSLIQGLTLLDRDSYKSCLG